MRLIRKAGYVLHTMGVKMLLKRVWYKLQWKLKLYADSSWKLSEEDRDEQVNTKFSKEITFSVVVPLYNTPEKYLRAMIESVCNQTYPNWQLCMADGSDASHPEVEKIAQEYTDKDKRICYKKLKENKGISGNTNEAIKMAEGDYIALFDHDDWLHPAVFYEYMKVIEEQDADFIYCDEHIFHKHPKDAFGTQYKPDYGVDTLSTNNYICHFSVFSRNLLNQTGMLRKEYDGSQDFDMVLRLTQVAQHVVHVPKVLYYWRSHPGSVASGIGAKEYCLESGRKAVVSWMESMGYKGSVELTAIPSTYRIHYELVRHPLVSVVIAVDVSDVHLQECIDSVIGNTSYDNYEILIAVYDGLKANDLNLYKVLEQEKNVTIVEVEGQTSYAGLCNRAAAVTKGEYYVFLSPNAVIKNPDWIEEMLMYAQREDVGAVGGKLCYTNDCIAHAGYILGLGGLVGTPYRNFHTEETGYAGRLQLVQNMTAVSATCMMTSKKCYNMCGGMDEKYCRELYDVDYCLALREKGFVNVFTPFADLYYLVDRTEDAAAHRKYESDDSRYFREKWKKALKEEDPYYNPHFTKKREDFTLV